MKAPMKMGPKILLVGGMDSSGGAGLMRDAAAVAELGGIARCAVTAVTAQTDKGVRWAMPVPSEGLCAQISAAFEDRVDAIKIGMLGNAMSVEAVAAALPPEGAVPLVLDPVLRASSGRALLDPAGLAAMIAHLFPRTDVLTPNLPELAALGAALGVTDPRKTEEVVTALMASGVRAILVKGGHDQTARAEAVDCLYLASGKRMRFASKRYPFDLRGTGCHLASAIAVGLAERRVDEGGIIAAVRAAKASLGRRFAAQEALDKGAGNRQIPHSPSPT